MSDPLLGMFAVVWTVVIYAIGYVRGKEDTRG